MKNKDTGKGHFRQGNDLDVGNNVIYFEKVKLEHVTSRVNTAKDRFREDGKG